MSKRLPYLDGVRALAILAVLGCHASGFANTWGHAWWGKIGYQLKDGVALFFVLSGYLLYRPFVAARLTGRPRMSTRAYAWHRMLRIVPAYWVTLTLLAIWPGLPDVFSKHWWVYYGFGQTYSMGTVNNGLAPAWSLCAEVAFYIALPVYAWGVATLASRGSRRSRVQFEFGVLALMIVAALAVRQLVFSGSIPPSWLGTLPGNLGWFAIGMGLAVAAVMHADCGYELRWIRSLAGRPWLCWTAACAMLVFNALNNSLLDPRTIHDPVRAGAENLLAGGFALLIVLPAAFPAKRAVPLKLLALGPIAWIGTISYGMFLWHFPLVEQLRPIIPAGLPWFAASVLLFVAELAVTVVVAAISWYLLERPLLRLKRMRLGGLRGRPEATADAAVGGAGT